MSKRTEINERDGVIITDLLANLCTELAQVFSSLSRITRTCLGLKEQFSQISPQTNNVIQTPILQTTKDSNEKITNKVENKNEIKD